MIGCIGKFKFSLAENNFVAWFQEVRMPIYRFFRRQSRSMNKARQAASLFGVLLISGCGDEPVAKPVVESVGDEKPITTPYYPMTVGSRWVYRSPDGSEWTREVAEIEVVNRNKLLFFSVTILHLRTMKKPINSCF